MLYHQKNILNHVLNLNLNLQGMSDDSSLQSKVVNCIHNTYVIQTIDQQMHSSTGPAAQQPGAH